MRIDPVKADSSPAFSIGWDVGGWNCDHNAKSRDAIVILDPSGKLVGTPWRGNLRQCINECRSATEWIDALFRLCGAACPDRDAPVVMAIDTPLGFSDAFRRLVNGEGHAGLIGDSNDNPYLYRQTERFLFAHGWKPLSPIKDMIGSQATKGMHVLAKFAPRIESCGIWTDSQRLRLFEGYPTVCRKSSRIPSMRKPMPAMPHPDIEDALLCALLARLFANEPASLATPHAQIPDSEGWIWVPADAVPRAG